MLIWYDVIWCDVMWCDVDAYADVLWQRGSDLAIFLSLNFLVCYLYYVVSYALLWSHGDHTIHDCIAVYLGLSGFKLGFSGNISVRLPNSGVRCHTWHAQDACKQSSVLSLACISTEMYRCVSCCCWTLLNYTDMKWPGHMCCISRDTNFGCAWS